MPGGGIGDNANGQAQTTITASHLSQHLYSYHSSFAKNAFAGIALRCNAFITVMQTAEVGNLDDPSDTRDLPNLRTLLVES